MEFEDDGWLSLTPEELLAVRDPLFLRDRFFELPGPLLKVEDEALRSAVTVFLKSLDPDTGCGYGEMTCDEFLTRMGFPPHGSGQ